MKILFLTLSESGRQSKRFEPFPTKPLWWPILAALTPKDVELSVQDESYQRLRLDLEADIVAISVATPDAPRAYQIGSQYRELGKTVVYGGSHITQIRKYPQWADEPFSHGRAAAIFTGDADVTWQTFLEDFERGDVRSVYDGGVFDFGNKIVPRLDLHKRTGLHRFLPEVVSLESSRGCNGVCTFCCANGMYMSKPLVDLAEELELHRGKLLNFIDSNLGANTARFRDFLQTMKRCGCSWAGSAYLPALRGMGNALREAGCGVMYIGIESVIPESTAEARKAYVTAEKCREVVDELHANGVAVVGSFVFGFDHDDLTVFERTLQFALQAKLDDASFHILTPYPGTAVFDKLLSEDRLVFTDFPLDWERYSRGQVVYEPKLLTPDDLKQGYEWLIKEFYSPRAIYRRLGNQSLSLKGAGIWLSNLLKWARTF